MDESGAGSEVSEGPFHKLPRRNDGHENLAEEDWLGANDMCDFWAAQEDDEYQDATECMYRVSKQVLLGNFYMCVDVTHVASTM